MSERESPECLFEERILVKVSGDLVESDSFYGWLHSVNKPGDYFLIIAGGGTAITKRLERAGIPFEFGASGREIVDLEGKKLAHEVLRSQKTIVESQIKRMEINADVIIPVTVCAGEIIHINGDEVAKTLYPYFGLTYVLTVRGKEKSFLGYEKLEVVPLVI